MICFNVQCLHENPDDAALCQNCGATLLLRNQYRGVRLLQEPETVSRFHQVFLVQDLLNHKPAVVHLFQDAGRLAQTADEIRLLLHRVHSPTPSPHFPQLEPDPDFTAQIGPGRPQRCLVLQYIEGMPLDRWIERYGRISQAQAVDWLKQTVDAISRLHDLGYVHRDLKPGNLLLGSGGQIVIIDFDSICCYAEQFEARFGDGPGLTLAAVGTPGYIAPEQADGRVLPPTDYFSIGRTFCYFLTGISPLQLPRSASGKLQWHRQAPQISPDLTRFIDRLMAPNLYSRPENRADILAYLDSLPRRAWWNRLRRSRLGRVLLGSAAVALTGLLLWGLPRAIAYVYLAEANENRVAGNLQAARQNYESASRFHRTSETYVDLAVVCQSQGDSDCAIRSLQTATQLDPNNAVAHYNLGVVYEFLNNNPAALAAYQRSAALDQPQRYDAINNIARLYLLQMQVPQAIATLEAVIDSVSDPPTRAAMLKNLAWAAYEQKQFTKADQLLRQSVQSDPTRADSYCLWALVNRALGQDAFANVLTCMQTPTTNAQPEVGQWKLEILRGLYKQ